MANHGPTESKTSERRLAAVEKQRQALELRKAGVSYPTIAERLGYGGPSGAFNAVASAIKRTLQEPADGVRELELERLDTLLLALWPQARQGNQGAIDRVLKIGERRAKLLGLDAPTKIAPTDPTGEKEYASDATNESRNRRIRALLEQGAAQGTGLAPAEPETASAPEAE